MSGLAQWCCWRSTTGPCSVSPPSHAARLNGGIAAQTQHLYFITQKDHGHLSENRKRAENNPANRETRNAFLGYQDRAEE